ncbi:MAG: PepSY-associated TM helix domain-containing protein [Bacteroidales bacterium]|nr:PepSY-associated TM helix domain-containing protein [Bacteroidales bacterium]
MKWRKLNRAVHRDLGYFFFGMTIIYAISGIAINHVKDWNPNYNITQKTIKAESLVSNPSPNKAEVIDILKNFGEANNYKKHYFPGERRMKVFLEGGSIMFDTQTGVGDLEKIKRRPILYEMNYLHYNPGKWWKYFSDLYGVGLFVLAITGLFVLKGKNGITGRGAWLTTIGVLLPLIFLFLYLN